MNKCFHPECESKAIKAHSLQEKGPLAVISDNVKSEKSQVYYFDDELQYNNENKVVGFFQTDKQRFRNRGTGDASTFLGFCDDHDKIFTAIETVPFTGSDKQCFLHSYRAFAYFMHHQAAAYKGIISTTEQRKEELNKLDEIKPNVDPNKTVVPEFQKIIDSLESLTVGLKESLGDVFDSLSEAFQDKLTEDDLLIKRELDKMLLEESFDMMHYCLRSIDGIFPIAASTVVTFLSDKRRYPSEDGIAYSAFYSISVIPDRRINKTHIIIGAFGDNPNILPQMIEFEEMETSEFLKMVSNLLIFRGKNTYLSPRMIAKMNPLDLNLLVKTRASKNTIKQELGIPNSPVNLFDKAYLE